EVPVLFSRSALWREDGRCGMVIHAPSRRIRILMRMKLFPVVAVACLLAGCVHSSRNTSSLGYNTREKPLNQGVSAPAERGRGRSSITDPALEEQAAALAGANQSLADQVKGRLTAMAASSSSDLSPEVLRNVKVEGNSGLLILEGSVPSQYEKHL